MGGVCDCGLVIGNVCDCGIIAIEYVIALWAGYVTVGWFLGGVCDCGLVMGWVCDCRLIMGNVR